MAKILVTGGAGFIGSNIADKLIEEGHKIVIIDNLSTGFRENINPKARFYEMDIRDKSIEEIFAKEKFDCVNHNAAQMDVRRSLKEPMYDTEVNILGSLNLILNSVKVGVKKFIYASTGGAVYGEPDFLPVTEEHPVKAISQYGISKHTVEHYLYLYNQLYGLDYTALRYANVFGPRQNPKLSEAGIVAIFLDSMLFGQSPSIFGDGEQLRDYIYIDDVVDANLLAMRGGNGEIFNIAAGRGVSVNEVFETLAKRMNFEKNPVYTEAIKGEVERIYLSAEKAEKVLGWQAKVGFEEGLDRTIEWRRASK